MRRNRTYRPAELQEADMTELAVEMRTLDPLNGSEELRMRRNSIQYTDL
jgi:hypothetical protein